VTSFGRQPPCATAGIDFTADRLSAHDVARAVDVCLECPVMVQCLDFLRHVEVAGIAAGMTELERQDWREAQGLERSPALPPVWATTPIQELTPADIEGLQVRVPTQEPPVPDSLQPTGDLILMLLRLREAGWKSPRIVQLFDSPELPMERVKQLVHRYVRYASSDHTDPSAEEMPWDLIAVDDLTSADVAGMTLFVERPVEPGRHRQFGRFTTEFVELVRRMTDEGMTAQEIADWFPGEAPPHAIDYLRREVITGSKVTKIRKALRHRHIAAAA